MIVKSPHDLALFIVSQRKKLKLTQVRIGDSVGLKQATISAFENKPESTRLDTFFRILSAVNMNFVLEPKGGPAPTIR